MKEPSESILCGRRAIENYSEITLIKDVTWDEHAECWYICFGVLLEDEPINLPTYTEWYITIDDSYPSGTIKVYPANHNGIKGTFFHQSCNAKIAENGQWRSGDLCLRDPYADICGQSCEPKDEKTRLDWNFYRTIKWIKAANKGNLIKADDFFELPQIPWTCNLHLVFDEDIVSFMEWESTDSKCGICTLIRKEKVLCVTEFRDLKGNLCKGTVWGDYFSEKKQCKYEAGWILLKSIPVVNGWQCPINYGELFQAIENQGEDFKTLITPLLKKLRKKKASILLIGFPIPKLYGGEKNNIHWWAIRLPKLSNQYSIKTGFRPIERNYVFCDFKFIIKNNREIEWMITENWTSESLMSRGMYSIDVCKLNFLIIGCGAVGSSVAEQLVRSGITRITLMDDDILNAGNIVRHSLEYGDIDCKKTNALKRHLSSINCHAKIYELQSRLEANNASVMNEYSVIIDCTGNDEVLQLLNERKKAAIVCSVSVGYRANNVYFGYHKGFGFPIKKYVDKFRDYIKKDSEDMEGEKIPWEGIGCWNPVFPACSIDMVMASTMAVKLLTKLIDSNCAEDKMILFQWKEKGNEGIGFYDAVCL
ncbi:ThiF family adenylyltransferase [Lachnospiraceae bacterium DSM 108991]|uniref:ThiF family adenylyltransferase n=1 Tax=Claveliimonas monacensis TaxID=2779351 RepID=A0ABR9RJ41_9FIRM|nr:ThiF family adenylyltransferase [Claveliimonas monacensis]MBE5062996.1 ThiF family adenylyltransferase [Claveliimonas monacensis]